MFCSEDSAPIGSGDRALREQSQLDTQLQSPHPTEPHRDGHSQRQGYRTLSHGDTHSQCDPAPQGQSQLDEKLQPPGHAVRLSQPNTVRHRQTPLDTSLQLPHHTQPGTTRPSSTGTATTGHQATATWSPRDSQTLAVRASHAPPSPAQPGRTVTSGAGRSLLGGLAPPALYGSRGLAPPVTWFPPRTAGGRRRARRLSGTGARPGRRGERLLGGPKGAVKCWAPLPPQPLSPGGAETSNTTRDQGWGRGCVATAYAWRLSMRIDRAEAAARKARAPSLSRDGGKEDERGRILCRGCPSPPSVRLHGSCGGEAHSLGVQAARRHPPLPQAGVALWQPDL
ncbi:unnamed protein product [Lepidochelys kempii]